MSMSEHERDMFVEASDNLVIDSATIQSIMKRLPCTPTLKIYDIALVMDISVMTVHRWIEMGQIETIDIGNGTEKSHKRVSRVGFIEFIKSRLNRV